MRILVYGAGVLGCNLARDFFKAGKDVTLLARGKWAETIKTNGLCIKNYVLPVKSTVRVPVVTELASEDEYDVIFVAARYTQVATIQRHRTPCQTFTLLPSVNPQLLRVLAISAFFNFVSKWQPGVGFKFYTSISHNHTPEVFFCQISPPSLHRSVSPLPLCSNTNLFFLCTWIIHAFLIRQVRGDGGFGKLKSICG